ncbi:MAG: FUSC family protein [Actinomycetota bacterium]|nr:FUSC family protein [Actinomycetota bacterium]
MGLNPLLRRGMLTAIPVAVMLVIELGFGAPTKGAMAGGALICGFTAFDAPAVQRIRWQAVTSVLIAAAAAAGILSSGSAVAAVLSLTVVGAAGGFMVAFSAWTGSLGTLISLALLIAQGLFLPVADIPPAFLWVAVGGLAQALWSAMVWVVHDRRPAVGDGLLGLREVLARIRSGVSSFSVTARHALRLGLALGVGVFAYRVLGLDDHGFWVPLTILFAMKPERDVTYPRLLMRAAGTAIGVVLATVLIDVLGDSVVPTIIVLTITAALSYGLLSLQYAFFTVAITIFIVMLDSHTGMPASEAVDDRLLCTGIGIAIAYASFLLLPYKRPAEEGRLTAASADAGSG